MKVFFAGMENKDSVSALFRVGRIQYGLFTVFPFICKQFNIPPMSMNFTLPDAGNLVYKIGKGVIMDSGLFTLMFGAHKGKRDEAFLTAWQAAIIKFVRDYDYKGTVVEVDCQKVLGPKKAWEFRKKLRDALPDNEQINVWHFEDGEKGLEKLATWSKYIALSVPEIRLAKQKNLPMLVLRLAKRVKEINPNVKIHLLGCTQKGVLKVTRFCDSCDSTSWQGINRWGRSEVITKGGLKKINRTYIENQSKRLVPAVKRWFDIDDIIPNPKNLLYYANYAFVAQHYKEIYTRYAGDQN